MRFNLSLILLLFMSLLGCASVRDGRTGFLTVEQLVEEDPGQIAGTEVYVSGWVCVDGALIDLRIRPRCDDTHGVVLDIPSQIRPPTMKGGWASIVGTFVDNSQGEMLLNYKRNRYLGNFAIRVSSIEFDK